MAETAILIVEDESIVALDLETRLIQLGYQVIGTAASGSDAIASAARLRPDLILMDIRLQGEMDGIAAAQAIQDQMSVPIIYLTAHSDTATLERAKLTQPYGYLVKPFNERELHTTMEMARYRHAMERKIEQQNHLLQSVIDTLPQGVALLDHKHRILSANRVAQAALMALSGLRVGDVIDQLGDLEMKTLCHQAATGLWHEVAIGPSPDARQIFEVIATPQPNINERGGWVLLLRDVTRERAIQRQVQQQHHLAAVGQLAAGIAHDFNNILAILSMTMQLVSLSQPDLTDENQRRLQTTNEQVARGAALIRQVLDFSRQSTLAPQSFDLVPFVKEIGKMIDRILPETIHFTFDHDADACVVAADPTQVQQVVMNLVINARDAMPDGGHLTLLLTPVAFALTDIPPFPGMTGLAWVRMTITDDGLGMTPEVREHIFEPFFTTKARDRGTGLGLAQVYGIVRQHGGFIDVHSAEGQGTTFTLYWPAAEPGQDEKANDNDTVKVIIPQAGQGQTLLLVEDDANVRQSTADVLRLLNYTVLEAASGQTAVAILEQRGQAIDLIITDMVMPEMTGADLCQWVKQHYPHLEVILLTGYAPEAFTGELQSSGFAHVIQKPVSTPALAEIIARILHKTPTETVWVDTDRLTTTLLPSKPALVPRQTGILHLMVVGTEAPLAFAGDRILILGRADDVGTDPEDQPVDFTPYQARELGVSRRHARLCSDTHTYLLEDLASRNGTRVNGQRLSPHQPYMLRSGDQVSLGELIFFVYFQQVESNGATRHNAGETAT